MIMSFLTSIYSLGNIMHKDDIEDLTSEQYLRLTQENRTPKKIEDMTIAEYVEYEKKMSENHISNTKTYLPTYFSKCAPTHDSIREFVHYFGPNQAGVESDCDSEDIEEEVEYMTNDEVVMSEQEKSNHGNRQNIQHFEEKDDVDKWLNAEITKHLSIQGVENTEDALISIIKSIKKEMKDDIMKKKIEASIANIDNETSSISSSEVDTEAKDNIMPLDVYKYLGLDKLRDAGTVENTTGTNEPLGAIDILVCYGQQNIDDTTREQRYYEWVAQNYEFSKHRTLTSITLNGHFPYDTNNPIPKEHLEQEENEQLPIRPCPCNYSFEEWLKIRIGHNNLHESDREFIFNEWILDSYDVEEEYTREIGGPYSKRFDKYNRVFKNEIEHLSNEYILRIGKNGYVLDDVWEKCQQKYKKINEACHDE
ncbi:hypothetical protein Tco_1230732, partial [Tanacetum coccineum]